MRYIILLLLMPLLTVAQQVDKDLLYIKQRMDSVKQFSATVTLDLEVPFINMPTKTAKMKYEKGKEVKFTSEDFVMLPKRGFDFSLSEIFEHPFITVDRGTEKINGKAVKVLSVIPTDNKSELALVTLYLDTKHKRIVKSEINTKKDGSYTLLMQYAANKDILPSFIEAAFAVEKLKIPLNFMGKDTKIDRKKLKEEGTKTGKIKMKITNYSISRT